MPKQNSTNHERAYNTYDMKLNKDTFTCIQYFLDFKEDNLHLVCRAWRLWKWGATKTHAELRWDSSIERSPKIKTAERIYWFDDTQYHYYNRKPLFELRVYSFGTQSQGSSIFASSNPEDNTRFFVRNICITQNKFFVASTRRRILVFQSDGKFLRDFNGTRESRYWRAWPGDSSPFFGYTPEWNIWANETFLFFIDNGVVTAFSHDAERILAYDTWHSRSQWFMKGTKQFALISAGTQVETFFLLKSRKIPKNTRNTKQCLLRSRLAFRTKDEIRDVAMSENWICFLTGNLPGSWYAQQIELYNSYGQLCVYKRGFDQIEQVHCNSQWIWLIQRGYEKKYRIISEPIRFNLLAKLSVRLLFTILEFLDIFDCYWSLQICKTWNCFLSFLMKKKGYRIQPGRLFMIAREVLNQVCKKWREERQCSFGTEIQGKEDNIARIHISSFYMVDMVESDGFQTNRFTLRDKGKLFPEFFMCIPCLDYYNLVNWKAFYSWILDILLPTFFSQMNTILQNQGLVVSLSLPPYSKGDEILLAYLTTFTAKAFITQTRHTVLGKRRRSLSRRKGKRLCQVVVTNETAQERKIPIARSTVLFIKGNGMNLSHLLTLHDL